MKAAIYVRVSTTDQNQELQLRELQEYAAAINGRSGKSTRTPSAGPQQPGLNQLMEDARARKLDIVLCWKLDRFGRSLLDCLANLRELDSHGVRFIATTQGLDTDNRNPASRFLLHVLGLLPSLNGSLSGRDRMQDDSATSRISRLEGSGRP